MTITVDGTAGITFPYGATQSTGAGPAFSAYASASQTVTLGTVTKVAIDTEEFDTNSNFDTSNYRFTPTVAGYYQVNGILRGTAATTFTQINVWIYKNGAAYKLAMVAGTLGATSANSISISAIIYMNGSTDYLELYGLVNGSGAATFVSGGTTATSTFSACLLRGA